MVLTVNRAAAVDVQPRRASLSCHGCCCEAFGNDFGGDLDAEAVLLLGSSQARFLDGVAPGSDELSCIGEGGERPSSGQAHHT
jgi:hypothetical protein